MEPPSHYFSEQVAIGSNRRLVPLRVGDFTVDLLTDRGVFSFGHIDSGTMALLEKAPPPPAAGTLLDLGCGYGPIAAWLAHRSPRAAVWAVDVNERALELARLNLADLPNVGVTSVNSLAADLQFDAIYSNPPIRVGKADLHQLLLVWLARLTPAGRAYFVVQRNLGADSLQSWLVEQGWGCTRIGSRRGYRVFEAYRPSPAAGGA